MPVKKIANYVRAGSLQEAYELNQKKTSRILGGMLWLRLGEGNIQTAIDLSELGLDGIEESEEEFSIGAMVTLRTLEQDKRLEQFFGGAIKKAVQDIVGVQFRNMATIGGSIWGRFGFSDVLTVFLALDTYVELFGAGIVPLSEFVKMDYDRDLLVRVIVKKTPRLVSYQAVRSQRTDFPILTCAVSLEGENCVAVIGARPEKAMALMDQSGFAADYLKRKKQQEAERAAEAAGAVGNWLKGQSPTGANFKGSAEYRKHLIKVLSERALEELAQKKLEQEGQDD